MHQLTLRGAVNLVNMLVEVGEEREGSYWPPWRKVRLRGLALQRMDYINLVLNWVSSYIHNQSSKSCRTPIHFPSLLDALVQSRQLHHSADDDILPGVHNEVRILHQAYYHRLAVDRFQDDNPNDVARSKDEEKVRNGTQCAVIELFVTLGKHEMFHGL